MLSLPDTIFQLISCGLGRLSEFLQLICFSKANFSDSNHKLTHQKCCQAQQLQHRTFFFPSLTSGYKALLWILPTTSISMAFSIRDQTFEHNMNIFNKPLATSFQTGSRHSLLGSYHEPHIKRKPPTQPSVFISHISEKFLCNYTLESDWAPSFDSYTLHLSNARIWLCSTFARWQIVFKDTESRRSLIYEVTTSQKSG